jgi:hypothetical protein
MRVAVIGVVKIGATVATGLARVGHMVVVAASRPLAELEVIARTLGVAGSGSVDECVERSDVVVLAIPFGRYVALPTLSFAGRVVIDAMNYWPSRDGVDPRLHSGELTSSELIQRYLPSASVVKSLNTMKWETLRDGGREVGDLQRLIIPASGDDFESTSTAMELIGDLGFDGINVGSLREGGVLQQPEGQLHGVLATLSTWSGSAVTGRTVGIAP